MRYCINLPWFLLVRLIEGVGYSLPENKRFVSLCIWASAWIYVFETSGLEFFRLNMCGAIKTHYYFIKISLANWLIKHGTDGWLLAARTVFFSYQKKMMLLMYTYFKTIILFLQIFPRVFQHHKRIFDLLESISNKSPLNIFGLLNSTTLPPSNTKTRS